jgi:hypothetical protein
MNSSSNKVIEQELSSNESLIKYLRESVEKIKNAAIELETKVVKLEELTISAEKSLDVLVF